MSDNENNETNNKINESNNKINDTDNECRFLIEFNLKNNIL